MNPSSRWTLPGCRGPRAKSAFRKSPAFLGAMLFLLLGGCGESQPPPPSSPPLSVLFIGNSFTYANNLPEVFTRLAAFGGHPVSTEMIAGGGMRLEQHAAAESTLAAIAGRKWDYVVLQEQSQIPAIPDEKTSRMYPAIRLLTGKIREAGAQPLLFLTWGRRNGCPEIGYQDFISMQEQLTSGYRGIADELGILVAPAGPAWKKSREDRPELDLWDGDGVHPGVAGTYLAACVFYAVVYRQSPLGLKYLAQLPRDTAEFLQAKAAETVLKDPGSWNIKK